MISPTLGVYVCDNQVLFCTVFNLGLIVLRNIAPYSCEMLNDFGTVRILRYEISSYPHRLTPFPRLPIEPYQPGSY